MRGSYCGGGGGTSRGLLSAVETGRNTERMPRSGAVPSGGADHSHRPTHVHR